MDLDTGKRLILPAFMAILLVFVLLQLQGLSLEHNVSQGYSTFYWRLAVTGVLAVTLTVAFGLKYGDIFELPTWMKASMHIIFIVFIAAISFSGNQIIPVPRASVTDFQLTAQTEYYTSTVVPAVTEDITYLWLLPMIIMWFSLLMIEYAGGVEPTRGMVAAVAVVACLAASIGYNVWVLPGFTSAHVPAYGDNRPAYLGATVFSFGQSMVYVLTGWFIPVAHFIHNSIVAYEEIYQVQGPG
jgi:hypothetical protein